MINSHDISLIDQRLAQIDTQIKELEQAKQHLLQQKQLLNNKPALIKVAEHQNTLTLDQKVALFANRFLGRQDVFAYRWQSKKTGRSGYSVACLNEWQATCHKPKIKCSECQHRHFQPLTKQVIYDHLSGNKTVGVYPLLTDPLNHCHFLAIDFDKSDWKLVINAVRKICQINKIPNLVERSRSGNGGHVWFFFNQPVPASLARKFGTSLLDKALSIYPALSFESYDRMFPNQDTLPIGGFGNLISLPLQREPRNQGNSVFIDENYDPLPDQWYALQQVQTITQDQLLGSIKSYESERSSHHNLAKKLTPIWYSDTHHKNNIRLNSLEVISIKPHTTTIELILSNQVFIPTKHLPNPLLAKLIQLASYNNPNFYKTQAMRFSTFGIPRRICMAHLEDDWLSLPRGCLKEVRELLDAHQIIVNIKDKRQTGNRLENKSSHTIKFNAILTSNQKTAHKAILLQDTGILQAPTAFGKTMVAIKTIVSRKCNTLILVHSKALLAQWQDKLRAYISGVDIGEIGRNKKSRTQQIDVATYQSLLSRDDKDHRVKPEALDYGYVVIDECHHVSAPNFSLLLSEISPKYILGLTATPERQDGHHPIMLMQIGQIIFKADNKIASFNKKLIVQELDTDFPEALLQQENRPHISELFNYLAIHDGRNQRILEDVKKVILEGRFPLLLTQRKDHANMFAESLNKAGIKTVLLTGGMGKKQQQIAKDNLAKSNAVIATGKYVGEGFDLPRLDTLFLAMPVSWKGLVVQYLGRIHRNHDKKIDVQVYDYVDILHPILKRMYKRRQTAYRKEGY